MILTHDGISPSIHNSCFLAHDCVIIGDVTIGAESSVWFKAVVRGDINYIRIGQWTNLQDGCIVHVTGETSPAEIGDYVTVGHGVILHGCKIGDGCLVGMGAIVMDDAAIGKGSLIAAGSVVKSGMKIPPGSMVAGNPAEIKREVAEDEAISFIKWAKKYRDYTKDYLK
jgi:carbonic anhydrase/acetyltransferase-like protein (isoleucine patch superfamily)